MSYQPKVGDVADATHRGQFNVALGGNYLVEPAPSVSIGNSSMAIETVLSTGSVRFGNSFPTVEQQTLTHPDGPDPNVDPNPDPEDGPDPDAKVARVDLITVNENGNANRLVGQPYKVDPPDRRFPRTRKPVPEVAPIDEVVVAALWVPEGVSNSEEMFDDWVIPREVLGTALNNLDLIPGRDLQFILDNAREGETLRGDRSQVIELAQPLTLRVPNVTIEGLNLRYADGAATSTADDMLTIATNSATVRALTLDGNKQNQPANADGITVQADARDNTVEDVEGVDNGGYTVNINGGYNDNLAVTDTEVSGVRATTPGAAAVVVQGRAYRTDLERIKCDTPAAGGGAVLVRNGATETTLRKAHCRSGDYTLKLADFGAQNDDTAPITNLDVETLTGGGVRALVANDLSAGVGHREVRIRNASGRGYPANTDALVDVSNINTATVADSSLTDWTGGPGIRASKTNSLVATGTTIARGDPDAAAILLIDGNSARIKDNTILGDDAFATGISVYALNENVDRAKVTGNNVYTTDGSGFPEGRAIRLQENGYVINQTHVKNNTANVVDESTGTNNYVYDNT